MTAVLDTQEQVADVLFSSIVACSFCAKGYQHSQVLEEVFFNQSFGNLNRAMINKG